MPIGSIGLTLSMRLATVMVPVAVYFLLLGLLNTRRTPQLLTGRQDFLLLIAALGPLPVFAILEHTGQSTLALVAALGGLTGLALLLSPRGRTWVIYNISSDQARNLVGGVLASMGVSHRITPGGMALNDDGSALGISAFPVLRNVSIRLRGGSKDLADRFQAELSSTLARTPVVTSPMGVSLLLVATAMLIAPLALVAGEVPEIVRVLTDLF